MVHSLRKKTACLSWALFLSFGILEKWHIPKVVDIYHKNLAVELKYYGISKLIRNKLWLF